MFLDALSVGVIFKGPNWVSVGICAAALAAVLWQVWESHRGTHRRFLSSIIGILMAFLAGISTQEAVEHFRSPPSNHHWMLDVALSAVSFILSFAYVFERKPPKSFREQLEQRYNPPSMFNKGT